MNGFSLYYTEYCKLFLLAKTTILFVHLADSYFVVLCKPQIFIKRVKFKTYEWSLTLS